jgi:hypothetical protein
MSVQRNDHALMARLLVRDVSTLPILGTAPDDSATRSADAPMTPVAWRRMLEPSA